MWLFRLKAEIWEVSSVSVISRLDSNKEVAPEIVKGVKAENKVWLIFVKFKRQQKMYARRI